jgi:hypothetical protein
MQMGRADLPTNLALGRSRDPSQAPTAFLEIVSDDFPLLHALLWKIETGFCVFGLQRRIRLAAAIIPLINPSFLSAKIAYCEHEG